MEEEFNFDNGDIVIIKSGNRLHDRKEKMFGIIVEQVGTERADHSKIVSLHIYGKDGKLTIPNSDHYIPEYVDYNTKELVPYKKAKETGYKELVDGASKSVLLMDDE